VLVVFFDGGKGSRNFKRSTSVLGVVANGCDLFDSVASGDKILKCGTESTIFAPTACITGRNAKFTRYFAW
jgi:hypothetical protein